MPAAIVIFKLHHTTKWPTVFLDGRFGLNFLSYKEKQVIVVNFNVLNLNLSLNILYLPTLSNKMEWNIYVWIQFYFN
jgi:hypothetical protein